MSHPGRTGGLDPEGPAEGGALDIVERALAVLDEESQAWVTRQRELAEQVKGGRDA